MRQFEGSAFFRSAGNGKGFLSTLITFYRTLLEYQVGGLPYAKNAPHKQRTGLFGMDSEKKKPGRSTAGKNRSPPLSHLRGPVCGFCRESKETAPRSHSSPRWTVFEGCLRRQDSFGSVWVSQASETEIPFTNPLHLTSSMACPKGWFILENGGDTWGRK